MRTSRVLPSLLSIAAVGAVAAIALATGRATTSDVTAQAAVDPVERGRYLVTIMGCSDCHTPKVPTETGIAFDQSRLLSGHPEGAELPPAPAPVGPWIATANGHFTAWSGPWGVSYAMNLTPDENTGIGIWTEDMFIRALRTGRHMGQSRPILPPMPWENFAKATDDDLRAIFAYLRSIPPIHNRIPEPLPPPPAPVAG